MLWKMWNFLCLYSVGLLTWIAFGSCNSSFLDQQNQLILSISKGNFQASQKGIQRSGVKEKLTVILMKKCTKGMPKWVGNNCSFYPVVFEWRKEAVFWSICTTHMILSLGLSLQKRKHYEAFKIVDTSYSLTHSTPTPFTLHSNQN